MVLGNVKAELDSLKRCWLEIEPKLETCNESDRKIYNEKITTVLKNFNSEIKRQSCDSIALELTQLNANFENISSELLKNHKVPQALSIKAREIFAQLFVKITGNPHQMDGPLSTTSLGATNWRPSVDFDEDDAPTSQLFFNTKKCLRKGLEAIINGSFGSALKKELMSGADFVSSKSFIIKITLLAWLLEGKQQLKSTPEIFTTNEDPEFIDEQSTLLNTLNALLQSLKAADPQFTSLFNDKDPSEALALIHTFENLTCLEEDNLLTLSSFIINFIKEQEQQQAKAVSDAASKAKEINDLKQIKKFIIEKNFEQAFDLVLIIPHGPARPLCLYEIAVGLIHAKKSDIALKAIANCSGESLETLLTHVSDKEKQILMDAFIEEQSISKIKILIQTLTKENGQVFLEYNIKKCIDQYLLAIARPLAELILDPTLQNTIVLMIKTLQSDFMAFSAKLDWFGKWIGQSIAQVKLGTFGQILQTQALTDTISIFSDAKTILIFSIISWANSERNFSDLPEVFSEEGQKNLYAHFKLKEDSHPITSVEHEFNKLKKFLETLNPKCLAKMLSKEPADPNEQACFDLINKIIELTCEQHPKLLLTIQKKFLLFMRIHFQQERLANSIKFSNLTWEELLYKCEMEEAAFEETLNLIPEFRDTPLSQICLTLIQRQNYGLAYKVLQNISDRKLLSNLITQLNKIIEERFRHTIHWLKMSLEQSKDKRPSIDQKAALRLIEETWKKKESPLATCPEVLKDVHVLTKEIWNAIIEASGYLPLGKKASGKPEEFSLDSSKETTYAIIQSLMDQREYYGALKKALTLPDNDLNRDITFSQIAFATKDSIVPKMAKVCFQAILNISDENVRKELFSKKTIEQTYDVIVDIVKEDKDYALARRILELIPNGINREQAVKYFINEIYIQSNSIKNLDARKAFLEQFNDISRKPIQSEPIKPVSLKDGVRTQVEKIISNLGIVKTILKGISHPQEFNSSLSQIQDLVALIESTPLTPTRSLEEVPKLLPTLLQQRKYQEALELALKLPHDDFNRQIFLSTIVEAAKGTDDQILLRTGMCALSHISDIDTRNGLIKNMAFDDLYRGFRIFLLKEKTHDLAMKIIPLMPTGKERDVAIREMIDCLIQKKDLRLAEQITHYIAHKPLMAQLTNQIKVLSSFMEKQPLNFNRINLEVNKFIFEIQDQINNVKVLLGKITNVEDYKTAREILLSIFPHLEQLKKMQFDSEPVKLEANLF
jgi:hypothetical protein